MKHSRKSVLFIGLFTLICSTGLFAHPAKRPDSNNHNNHSNARPDRPNRPAPHRRPKVELNRKCKCTKRNCHHHHHSSAAIEFILPGLIFDNILDYDDYYNDEDYFDQYKTNDLDLEIDIQPPRIKGSLDIRIEL